MLGAIEHDSTSSVKVLHGAMYKSDCLYMSLASL